VSECGEGQTDTHTDARNQYTFRVVYENLIDAFYTDSQNGSYTRSFDRYLFICL